MMRVKVLPLLRVMWTVQRELLNASEERLRSTMSITRVMGLYSPTNPLKNGERVLWDGLEEYAVESAFNKAVESGGESGTGGDGDCQRAAGAVVAG